MNPFFQEDKDCFLQRLYNRGGISCLKSIPPELPISRIYGQIFLKLRNESLCVGPLDWGKRSFLEISNCKSRLELFLKIVVECCHHSCVTSTKKCFSTLFEPLNEFWIPFLTYLDVTCLQDKNINVSIILFSLFIFLTLTFIMAFLRPFKGRKTPLRSSEGRF